MPFRARSYSLTTPPDDSTAVAWRFHFGFGNVYPSRYPYPGSTIINQPFDLIAAKAIDMILAKRDNKMIENYIIPPTRFVVGESAAPSKT